MANRSTSPVIETLADLIRINSVNPAYTDGVSESRIAEYVHRFFATRGIECWYQQVYPGRPNVIARVPGRQPDRRIILEAHTDTVSAEGMSIAPFEPRIEGGRIFGRGSCDTKGGLAAMMHAMDRTSRGRPPICDVVLAAVIDEEYSYRGVVAVCHSLADGPVDPATLTGPFPPASPIGADAAIVAEPTELQAAIASKGLLRWTIETRGRSAHSSKPHLGINAIEKMARVVAAIESDNGRLDRDPHPLLGPATCSIGVIRGGVQVNSVPQSCEIEIDRRMLPGETGESVLSHYRRLIDDLVQHDPQMDVVMHPPALADLPLETPRGERAVGTMLGILGQNGRNPDPIGVAFCSDASKFGAIGIPSMILGPGSIDQAHAAVEYIDCEQVIEALEVYHRFITEFE